MNPSFFVIDDENHQKMGNYVIRFLMGGC